MPSVAVRGCRVLAVSNASPLISLSAIGKLDLLPPLYGSVTIPEAVFREVVGVGSNRPGASEVRNALASWCAVQPVGNTALVAQLQREISVGEAEAIALAVELQADVLLLDERRARAIASRHSVSVTGAVGVLLIAKGRGLVPAVKPLLDTLRTTTGFRLSSQLYREALLLAGE